MANPFQTAILGLLKAADLATTKSAKGKAFEDLVCHLFLQIPGVVNPQRNKKNVFDTEECLPGSANVHRSAGLPGSQFRAGPSPQSPCPV